MGRKLLRTSPDLTARQRAQQAQQQEAARQKRITALLVDVFTALDARAAADVATAKALYSLKAHGEPVAAIAEKTGLTTRQVNVLIKLARENGTSESGSE